MENQDGEKVIVNVGGVKFQLSKSELNRQPDGRLGDTETLSRYYRSELNEFYFDRNPRAFKSIANYYRTGKLHLPKDVCWSEFKDELLFWRISPELLEDCCWVRYQRAVRGGNVTAGATRVIPGYEGSHPVWKILENVHPFWVTKIYPVISSIVIIIMLTVLCLETLPEFKHYRVINGTDDDYAAIEPMEENAKNLVVSFIALHFFCLPFFVVELVVYIVFFVLEKRRTKTKISLRLILKSIIVPDVIHTIVYILSFTFANNSYIYPVLTLKVFRILWFMRFWNPGRVLHYILKTRWNSIVFFVITSYLTGVFFSIWVFFAESDSEDSHFRTVTEALYWALVTLTTVGYGDMRPIGLYGKLVGTLCSLCAIVFIGLLAAFLITSYIEFFLVGQYKRRSGEGVEAQGENVTKEEGEDVPLKTTGEENVSPLETVTFLVDHVVFEVNKSCLESVALEKLPRDSRGVYSVDGDTECVAAVINYYRTGRLHVPQSVCETEFKAELDKWDVKPENISECCWSSYKQSVSKHDVINGNPGDSRQESCMATTWKVLENTNPRWYTKVYVTISAVFIVMVIFVPPPRFTVVLDDKQLIVMWSKELICILFFIVELCLRFACCPQKATFFLTPITILDVLSIVGMICALFIRSYSSIVNCFTLTLRALRGFHFCYFLRNTRLARCACYLVTAGLKDFLYLLVLYGALTFVFATCAYSADISQEDSQLTSIIGALWWAYITMTTVGYGDVTPVGGPGKHIGALCCITGVFMLSLVAAVIIHRFVEYINEVQYRRVKKLFLYCCKRDNIAGNI